MTSAGGHSVIPNYGAVSAAKAVLESHLRQLAFELMPYGITANAIQAGVTITPGSSKIPGIEQLAEFAKTGVTALFGSIRRIAWKITRLDATRQRMPSTFAGNRTSRNR
jgi:enoyl-[acyl-carrier-protein] reductase (NADH)